MEPISWFAPKLSEAVVQDSGPYYPDENVTVSVTSERYYLSKDSYEDLTSFGLRSDSGRVIDHTLEKENPGEINDPEPEALARWHRWTVEIPASEFTNQSQTVATYPSDHPEVEYSTEIPDVDVYVLTDSQLETISMDVKYRVERPEYTVRQTTKEGVRDSLLSAGYEVARVSDDGRKYELQEHKKVADAEYETEQTQFDNRGQRGDFLQLNPEWSEAGTIKKSTTKTKTVTEWRSNREGSGTFTGETREKLVDRAVTRSEKKFRYETTETYQTQETYQDTVTRRVSRVEYEERCTAFGCQMYGRTVTETHRYTVTKTRTVTRTRTNVETYWSTRAQSPTHEYTGQRRTITVEPAEYDRQYQYEVKKEETNVERVFLAENRVQTSPAEYEWQEQNTIHDKFHAETAAKAEDVRIANVRSTNRWTMKKQTDSEIGTVSDLRSDWIVLQTIGTGEATLVREYGYSEADRVRSTVERSTKLQVTHQEPNLVSNKKIKNILLEKLREENEV